ncbi:MAG: hypothetical protein ACF8R7_17300 [Phycisphaerales bacterium JB039]
MSSRTFPDHPICRLPALLQVVGAAEALGACPHEERSALARLLIEHADAPALRGWRRLLDQLWAGSTADPRSEARAALIQRWAYLPAAQREQAAALRGSWDGAFRRAGGSPDPVVRASAALAAGVLQPIEGLEACLGLLGDADPMVVREAERALVRAATAAAEDPTRRDAIEPILARAAGTFGEHRRHGALLAAIFLLDMASLSAARRGAGGPLGRWAAGEPDDGHSAMRSALRKTNHPIARRRALEWLALETMATAALDRLNRAADAEEHEAALAPWHLTLRPARRERLALLRPKRNAADGPIPPAGAASGLSEQARIGLCHWVALARLSEEQRRPLAERALADPSEAVRWTAMRLAPERDLEDFAFDRDERISASALLRLSGAGAAQRERAAAREAALRRATRLLRHPAGPVRALAATESARLDPWAPGPRGALCARTLLRAEPEGFLEELRQRIGAGTSQVHAIALARRLGLCAQVEPQLLEVVRRSGPAALASCDEAGRAAIDRAGATAVMALGELSSDVSGEALDGALRHTSARVRANAIEAMARRARRQRAPAAELRRTLLELKTDPAHRVRASAILALLRGEGGSLQTRRAYEPAAAEQLGAMLIDDRPMHRVAGLWAAQRLLTRGAGAGLGRHWTPLAARLAGIAQSDDHPGARSRAAACVRMLQVEVRSGWRGRAPSLEAEEVAA